MRLAAALQRLLRVTNSVDLRLFCCLCQRDRKIADASQRLQTINYVSKESMLPVHVHTNYPGIARADALSCREMAARKEEF